MSNDELNHILNPFFSIHIHLCVNNHCLLLWGFIESEFGFLYFFSINATAITTQFQFELQTLNELRLLRKHCY